MILPKGRRKLKHNNINAVNNMYEVKTLDTAQLPNKALHVKLKQHRENVENHNEVHFHDILTTERVLNAAEQQNHKHSIAMLSHYSDTFKNTTVTDESDKKFMALLDTLEKEVKHVDLRDKEKQIFDAKIKKIYGEVVGKQSNALKASDKIDDEHLKQSKNHDNKQIIEDDENVVRKLLPSFDAKDESNFIDEPNYQDKRTDTETDEKYSQIDMTAIEPDEMQRTIAKKQKSFSSHDDREKYSRRNGNFRHNNRNHFSSLESIRQKYDNGRKTHRNGYRTLRHKSNSLDYKRNKNYFSNDEDILSTERKKYYQDKLDSMERKLQDGRRFNRRNDVSTSKTQYLIRPNQKV